jgi:hypothetical protein
MSFIECLKYYAELGYFIAGIVLAAAAIYGLKQIRLTKTDIEERKKRAAMEKAMEYYELYESKFTPLINEFDYECSEKGLDIGGYKQLEQFDKSGINPSLTQRRNMILSWFPAFNVLETIATAFVIGLADENIGYSLFGPSFVRQVYRIHDIIVSNLKFQEFPRWMEMTIKLYLKWAPKYQKEYSPNEQSDTNRCE